VSALNPFLRAVELRIVAEREERAAAFMKGKREPTMTGNRRRPITMSEELQWRQWRREGFNDNQIAGRSPDDAPSSVLRCRAPRSHSGGDPAAPRPRL